MIDCISARPLDLRFCARWRWRAWQITSTPAHNRERFEEAHDLIGRRTRPGGPFRWEGKHFQYRVVNPWALPLQKTASAHHGAVHGEPETVIWAAQHRYPYVVLGSFLEQTQELIQIYRDTAQEEGYNM